MHVHVCALVVLPVVGLCQGAAGGLPYQGALPAFAQSGLSSLPGLGSFDIGAVKIDSFIRVGFQRMTVHFNLPATWRLLVGPGNPTTATLDVRFRDADL